MVAEKEALEDESLAIDCPILVTERLLLRPPHVDDIPELAQLANNRRIAEMLARMPHPYGEAEARAFLSMSQQKRTAGCAYAVTLAESGAFIGSAGLNATDDGLELGYWIGEPYWKHGYATEAAQGLIQFAFQQPEVQKVWAHTLAEDNASSHVLRKCGLSVIGEVDDPEDGRLWRWEIVR